MHIDVLRKFKPRIFVLGLNTATVFAGVGSWAVSAEVQKGDHRLGPVLYGSDDVGAPARAPGPPRIVEVEALDGAVRVVWRPDDDSGDFPVSNFRVVAEPGPGTCLVSAAYECVIRGLINGKKYRFTVSALSGAGWSTASQPSAEVTPDTNADFPREPTPPPTSPPDATLDLILERKPNGDAESFPRISVRPAARLAAAPRLAVRPNDRFTLSLAGFTPARKVRTDFRTARSWQRLTVSRTNARGVVQLRYLAVMGNGDIAVRVGISPKRARFLVITTTAATS